MIKERIAWVAGVVEAGLVVSKFQQRKNSWYFTVRVQVNSEAAARRFCQIVGFPQKHAYTNHRWNGKVTVYVPKQKIRALADLIAPYCADDRLETAARLADLGDKLKGEHRRVTEELMKELDLTRAAADDTRAARRR